MKELGKEPRKRERSDCLLETQKSAKRRIRGIGFGLCPVLAGEEENCRKTGIQESLVNDGLNSEGPKVA